MNGFSLTYKDYKSEYYEKSTSFRGKPINMIVKLSYHNYLKYWSVHYRWEYGKQYFVEIDNYSAENKKDAINKANQFMRSASVNDINKIKDKEFCIQQILSN